MAKHKAKKKGAHKGKGKHKARKSAKRSKSAKKGYKGSALHKLNIKRSKAAKKHKGHSKKSKAKKRKGHAKKKRHTKKSKAKKRKGSHSKHRKSGALVRREVVYARLIAKGYEPARAAKIADRYSRMKLSKVRKHFAKEEAAAHSAAQAKQMADFGKAFANIGKFHASVTA
jgi:hypothetical protein